MVKSAHLRGRIGEKSRQNAQIPLPEERQEACVILSFLFSGFSGQKADAPCDRGMEMMDGGYDQLHDVHGLAPRQRLPLGPPPAGGGRQGRGRGPHPHLLQDHTAHGHARHRGGDAVHLPGLHGRGPGHAAGGHGEGTDHAGGYVRHRA